jgi:hypothetical protein
MTRSAVRSGKRVERSHSDTRSVTLQQASST